MGDGDGGDPDLASFLSKVDEIGRPRMMSYDYKHAVNIGMLLAGQNHRQGVCPGTSSLGAWLSFPLLIIHVTVTLMVVMATRPLCALSLSSCEPCRSTSPRLVIVQ